MEIGRVLNFDHIRTITNFFFRRSDLPKDGNCSKCVKTHCFWGMTVDSLCGKANIGKASLHSRGLYSAGMSH